MVAGGSLAEAAEFLGISSGYGSWPRQGGRVYSAAGIACSAARQQPDPLSFETGLKTLTRELDDPGTPLVNYQRRRQALETWSISEDAWPTLAARRSLMARPENGDRKRQLASVYVWTRVTSGEHRFAPRPIEAAQPLEVQEDWRRSWHVTWRDLRHTSDPRSHYTLFRAELDAFAAALAKTIDTAGHTPEGRIDQTDNDHRSQRHLQLGAGHPPATDHGRQLGITVIYQTSAKSLRAPPTIFHSRQLSVTVTRGHTWLGSLIGHDTKSVS
jgi:hypothetical protein